MSIFNPKTLTLRGGAEVSLRSPTADDAPRLLRYLDAVRRQTPFIQWGPDDALPTLQQERQWVQSRRDRDGSVILIAEAAGEVISICGVDRDGPYQRIDHGAELGISIDAAWCDGGLGTLLMGELIAWATRHPALSVLRLGAFADNDRAIALYTKLGFEPEGRRRWRLRRGDALVDEVIMSRWVGQTGGRPAMPPSPTSAAPPVLRPPECPGKGEPSA